MLLSASDLAEIRAKALACDDDERKRRGKSPRPTRCRQCATILTLLAHVELEREANQRELDRLGKLFDEIDTVGAFERLLDALDAAPISSALPPGNPMLPTLEHNIATWTR